MNRGELMNLAKSKWLEDDSCEAFVLMAVQAYEQGRADMREEAAKEFDRRSVYADGKPSSGWYEPNEPAEIIRSLP